MNTLTETKTLTLIGFFVLGLSCSPALADLDPLVMYDDFNAKSFNNCKKCIDITKWLGVEKGMSIGEIQRKIKAKRAFFAIRSWGKGTEDVGNTNARNRLAFRDDPGSITGVCFTPRVKKMELNDCEANVDAFSGVQLRYMGNVYDSDVSEDNSIGVVQVQFTFAHNTRDEEQGGLKKGEFRAMGFAWQCADEDCYESGWSIMNTGDGYINPDLDFGVFKKSNKTEFCFGYDSDEHELVFSAGDDVRTVNAADNNLPAKVADVHSNQVGHVIEVRTDAPNCQKTETDGMVSVYFEGDVDNVKVRRRP